jgi:hypothetical protein
MKQHPALPGRSLLLAMLAFLAAGSAYGGTCSSPTGNEGDIKYNGNYHTYQFCNGTNWLAYGGGASCALTSSGYNPTVPSGNGYFVLSKSAYNGNLGGRTGADATCLTELTTNTGWMGYSTANANGQLVAAKVRAFICDAAICNNLMPLTTYYFANAANSSAGGASFTTDVNGLGPNDSADWAAANYFSGTYAYWTTRGSNSNTQWKNTTIVTSNFACPTNWSTTAGGDTGAYGNSAFTTFSRWQVTSSGSTAPAACALTLNLICIVNP